MPKYEFPRSRIFLSEDLNKSENKHYDHVFEVGGNSSVGESTRRRADIA